MSRALSIFSLLVLPLVSSGAEAHPLAPALLEVHELADGRAEVSWKTSRVRLSGARVRPILPLECQALTPPMATGDAASVTVRWALDCGPPGLIGRRLEIEGLEGARIEALVRVILADGRVVSEVVRADEPWITVPERPGLLAVARGYGSLGFEHILSGLDHLLFVFGLLLLVSGIRRLVQTVTAFTVGHSITLSLAALGIAEFPPRPIEVLIAASVFALAVELARPRRQGLARSASTKADLRRSPEVMALAFGLLHGLGFAGALREVGLPENEIPLALAAFNAGIELGQLLFVVGVLSSGWLFRAWLARLPPWASKLQVYALGSLAAFWLLERTVALFV